MSLRVHELAKELKLTSKELIEKLQKLSVDVKSHMSPVTEDQAKLVRQVVSPAPPAPPVVPVKEKEVVRESPKGSSMASASSSIQNAKRELLNQKAAQAKAATLAAQASAEARKAAAAAYMSGPSSAPAKTTTLVQEVVSTPKPAPSPAVEVKKAPVSPVVHAPVSPPPAPAAKPMAQEIAPAPPAPPAPQKTKKIQIRPTIIVKDLATLLDARPSDVIVKLMKLKIFASINQAVHYEIASKIAVELGFEVGPAAVESGSAATTEKVSQSEVTLDRKNKNLQPRAPIVTFMGHVDHGKTSLLDAIRKTHVAKGEAGGITQHIGAYEVFLPKGAVTFLDTPGHEAFTAMRARGARVTDVVVLVVAADDGVMPQTIEAIDHAKAASVPIVVAINKIDLPSANPDRVKKSLMEYGLMSEEWGGKTIMVGVSAKTGKGIDDLLEMLALESELLELKADSTVEASGVVVEAELSGGSGVLATALVQNGTLRVGDIAIVGDTYCKIRAMINDRGQRVKEALPSMPVEILGLSEMPRAGDRFYVVKDERKAKEIIDARHREVREKGSSMAAHVTLEHLLDDIKAGKVEELKLIVKSDVQGSVEAIRTTLAKIPAKNVRLNVIHTGVGDIAESDVMLAAASNAVVIGFHVGMTSSARDIADREQVDVRFYEIIYEAKTAIEKAMEGLLQPEAKEVFVGMAEVRQVFKVSKAGTIAGCTVQKGKIVRNFTCRVIRAGKKVHDGKVDSLKRFKDDAREVLEGFECGIGVSNFDEILPGDRIEVIEVQMKARKLE